MDILNKINKAILKSISLLSVSIESSIVTESFIELTVLNNADAEKIKNGFIKKFPDVSIFDLSEIDEDGFMVNIPF